jgi:hypothetical protein
VQLRLAALVTLSLATAACTPAGLAEMSAEPTACPAEQLEISEEHQPMEGPSSWTATCVGPDGARQKWFCSKMHQQVICTEDPR